MARISQDQTQERRAFLLELFRSQPDISRNDAMETYKERFGASLNAKTFNELREQASSETDAPTGRAEDTDTDADADTDTDADAPTEERSSSAPLRMVPTLESPSGAAPSAKKPKPAKGPGVKNVFVDATPEQLQFLERVVHQLQEAGANNLRIDHGTDRWMVLTVDSK